MSDHVVSTPVYIAIFLALLVLTAVTVGIAFLDLGPLNDVLALGIAGLKATLVVLFFMHVRYSVPLIWLTAAGGLVWLLILFGLTLLDYLSRGFLGGV